MMLHILQIVATTPSPDISAWALKAIATAVLGYVGHEIQCMRKEMAQWRLKMTKWEVHLFGINGDNGLNGTVNEHTDWIDRYERRHGPPDRRHHSEDAS